MNTTTKIVLAAVIGVIVGAGGVMAFSSNEKDTDMAMQHQMPGGSMMQHSMEGMMASLDGKTGDAFDQAFLSEMILHHEGAVEMAQQALQHARHQEIKDLAEAIISAQNQEIAEMKTWQEQWYGVAQ